MKVNIITFHFVLNYGAVLQAYALSECLKSMGHDVEFTDYQPDRIARQYQWKWKYCGLHPTNFIYLLLQKRFNHFRSTNLKLSNRLYRSLEELMAHPPKADVYICGSDQIWNPEITGLDSAYFLDFGSKDVKRIAYAGSFGKTELTAEQRQQVKQYVSGLNYLSVRETSGAELINTICGRRAEYVVDPTLLIDNYDSITEPCQAKEGYVLVINLQNNTLLDRTADFVSRELNLPKVVLNNYSLRLWEQRGKRLFPGPGGYLGLIKHASFVVTNSFHGIVFAIVFKKPFLATSLSGDKTQRNSRITGLLKVAGLSDCFVDVFSEKRIKGLIATPTEWAFVKSKVDHLREESLRFLKTSLTD